MDLILIKFLGAELLWNTSNSKIDYMIFVNLGHSKFDIMYKSEL